MKADEDNEPGKLRLGDTRALSDVHDMIPTRIPMRCVLGLLERSCATVRMVRNAMQKWLPFPI